MAGNSVDLSRMPIELRNQLPIKCGHPDQSTCKPRNKQVDPSVEDIERSTGNFRAHFWAETCNWGEGRLVLNLKEDEEPCGSSPNQTLCPVIKTDIQYRTLI